MWILRTACLQLVEWARDPQTAHWTLAVNVSARQFRHSHFVDEVLGVLEETGANPHRLKLELTETLLLEMWRTPSCTWTPCVRRAWASRWMTLARATRA